MTTNEVLDQTLTSDDLGTDSVNADEIAQNAVQSDEIQTNAVGGLEIAAAAVGESEFGGLAPRFNTVSVPGGGTAENGSYTVGQVAVSCLGGEQLISANARRLNDANPAGNEELWVSEVEQSNAGVGSATAQFGNDSGTARTAVIQANCLP